jgi:hypothetical protein
VLTKNAQEDVMGRESKRAYTIIDENNEHFKKFTLFLTRWEEMAFTATGIWGPSIDMNVFNGSEKYNKYREKLIKESQAELDKGNLVVYDEMEKKLIDAYKADLKERKIDTEIYDSGSKLAVKDDLRMAVMSVGPMPIGVGAGKYEGMIGALLCESEDGVIKVAVGSGLKDDQRLIDVYTGKIISVKYNERITNKAGDQSLFLPIFDQLREDKDVADVSTMIK